MHRGLSGKTAPKDCRLHFALKRKIPSHVLADIPRALARLEAEVQHPAAGRRVDEEESDESEPEDGSEEEAEAEDSGSDEPVVTVKQAHAELPESFNAADDDGDLPPPKVLGVRQRSESIDEDDASIKPKKSRTQSPLFGSDDDAKHVDRRCFFASAHPGTDELVGSGRHLLP
ncbi:hypothetical protein HMN09_01339500 [Mycena chlorophos]|uniref:Uncharacterized protein n=1 Tax=Mycena chlorophos TaxID=658473 RepID=A0A8H6RZI0_MYCCL|nr:hypothetical protein HMN09_01339500 [Mycena chlorophos]